MIRLAGGTAFVVGVVAMLFWRRPMPTLVPLSYANLANGYSELLIGLGGFAITVLAVLLGLEALGKDRPGSVHADAHQAVVRHVALSLAVACLTCFVGANMLKEVHALGISVERAQAGAQTEITQHLLARRLEPAQIAQAELEIQSHLDQSVPKTVDLRPWLPETSEPVLNRIEATLTASVQRHFLLGSVSAYLASFLLLQALSFLLLMRFPQHRMIDAIQNLGVLGVAATLFLKMVVNASSGLTGDAFLHSRLFIAVLLIGSTLGYAVVLQRASNRLDSRQFIRSYTPLMPYFLSLVAMLMCFIVQAATFGKYGPVSDLDRWMAFGLPTVATGMLLVIQISRPTLRVLMETTLEPNTP